MNREFLQGLKVGEETLPKEVVDSIMAEYGKAFKEKDEKISTLTTKTESLESQLKENNDKIKELSSIDADKLNEKIKTLTEKYDNDTKELNEKLSKQTYDYKIKDMTSGLKFSSESARKSFINDLSNKGLKLEDDKILGFDDFVNEYKESDPNAFASEETPATNVDLGGSLSEPTNGDDDSFVNHIMGLD